MPLLSDYARKRKCGHFIGRIPKSARVLEVGCGDGWLGAYMRAGRWAEYVGVDLYAPADIVGDIRAWRDLGLQAASFDVVVAFEVVEHGDFFDAMFELLKPGGLLMLTSPMPSRDWVCRWLEELGLSQRRGSPHTHLVWFEQIPRFEPVELRQVGFLSQWGIFRKPVREASA